jgi:phage terminase large subunit-like protein
MAMAICGVETYLGATVEVAGLGGEAQVFPTARTWTAVGATSNLKPTGNVNTSWATGNRGKGFACRRARSARSSSALEPDDCSILVARTAPSLRKTMIVKTV